MEKCTRAAEERRTVRVHFAVGKNTKLFFV